MPTYEYYCNDCGIRFSKKLHYYDNSTKVVCPKGHPNVHRVFSPPAIVFKGSGWYCTDNKTKTPSPSTKPTE